jgi:hypothetical protein
VALNRSHKKSADAFALSTYGSHHIHLINHIANLFNSLHVSKKATHLKQIPVLPLVQSGETFGIVHSEHIESFGGLLEIKEEEDNETLLMDLLDGNNIDISHALVDDPSLLTMPQETLPDMLASAKALEEPQITVSKTYYDL